MDVIIPPQLVLAPSLNNVNKGATATLEIPLDGRRVHRVHFHVVADDADPDSVMPYGISNIASEIRVKLGGRTVQIYSPQELVKIVELNGAGFCLGDINNQQAEGEYFCLPFAQDWRRTEAEAVVLGWGTGGLAEMGLGFTIEIDLIQGTHAVHSIKAQLEIDYPRTVPTAENPQGRALGVGEVWKVDRYVIPNTTAGKHMWNTIDRLDRLYRLHLFSSRVSEVEILADNIPIFRQTKKENDEQLRVRGFNPQHNVFSVVFDRSQVLNQFLNLEKIGQINVNISHFNSGQPYNAILERMGTPAI